MVLAFIAQDIADWVGIPVAVVIVGMVILRRAGQGASQPETASPQKPSIVARANAMEISPVAAGGQRLTPSHGPPSEATTANGIRRS